MAFAIIILVGLMGVAAMFALAGTDRVFAHGNLARFPEHHTSPLDEAERIVARRYARGEISSEEFERMRAILNR